MTLANGLNAAQEGVQYQSTAGSWSGLTAGAAGTVLTSNGAAVAPSFQVGTTGLGIGKWVLLSSQACSGQTAISFTSVFDRTIYQQYVFLITSVCPNTVPDTLYLRTSINNGSSYSTSGYSGGTQYAQFNFATFVNITNGVDALNLPAMNANTKLNGQLQLTLANDANANTAIIGDFQTFSSAALVRAFTTDYESGSPVNAMQFTWASGGTFQGLGLGGTISLYGILETGGGGSGGGITWFDVTGTSASMTTNNGYVADNAGLVTLTLPATANIGDQLTINGKGAGGWTIAQNAGQSIQFGILTTTVGVTGSLSSSNRYDNVILQCITAGASTLWTARSSGNLQTV